MKRKYLLGVSAIIFVAVWLVFFAPQRLFDPAANIEYGWCEYYSDEYEYGEYLTLTEAQAEEMLEILGQLRCHRVWGEDRHFLSDFVLQISLYIDGRPFHVVFGRRDFCYDGKRGPFQQFDIIGGDEATRELLALLGIEEDRINGRREI